MKRLFLFPLILVIGLSLATVAFAGDRDLIQNQVDEIVAALNDGKEAEDFAHTAHNEPYYVFIMQDDGSMHVHPTLAGTNLKDTSEELFEILSQATPEGVWVQYDWHGEEKNTYVKMTADDMIVGSGY